MYNEEKRIGITFKALNQLVLPYGLKLKQVIFVNDGSKDRTVKMLNDFKNKSKLGTNIKIVSYSQNQVDGRAN